MLTALVSMALFEPLGPDCDPRYLNQPFWHSKVLPGLPKMASFGYFAITAKLVGSGYPISSRMGYNVLFAPS